MLDKRAWEQIGRPWRIAKKTLKKKLKYLNTVEEISRAWTQVKGGMFEVISTL